MLLEEEQPFGDPPRADAIASTIALLRTAIGQAAGDPGAAPSRAARTAPWPPVPRR
ncbi:hypothetical protein [Streptomyces sp. CC224B]|uniref:hypothetical protein n=1 Tax=Streptomyces sp. CC224B TaxID=3044571 RepID=UPI0024A93495|nr:hypothetical protein [Streptomyces sp. CC224B]